MEVVLHSDDRKKFSDIFESIKTKTLELELLMSKYNPLAELFQFNNNAKRNKIIVSKTLCDIIKKCIYYNKLTYGYFDVCYGSNHPNTYPVHVGHNLIKFSSPETEIDLGAIGKGIVLNYISEILEQNNINNALISFGESSVLTKGKHPHGEYWPVSFQGKYNISKTLKLNNDTISISGYHKNKAHIKNPLTKKLVRDESIICVQSNCPVEAEVLSTALFASPRKEHNNILKNFNPKTVIYGD